MGRNLSPHPLIKNIYLLEERENYDCLAGCGGGLLRMCVIRRHGLKETCYLQMKLKGITRLEVSATAATSWAAQRIVVFSLCLLSVCLVAIKRLEYCARKWKKGWAKDGRGLSASLFSSIVALDIRRGVYERPVADSLIKTPKMVAMLRADQNSLSSHEQQHALRL